ncbi:hypothetical protein BDL97_10G043400 [Sphagnum fallax]|nr:hypothetical protein BDL97_10G043400 [Sphagnum fallax]KAH8949668.1 hypothetical protein BDL97_10G043400 [Sphagnum fallax]KAH8949669.1 hypothetical protein BDL97_10G043400 [Sphagnum fallax]
MEDFCHPRCQLLFRSSFASDMDSGHSRMGMDSGECLNVIFEVTPSNISMSLMRSLIRCTHEVMTALIVLLPLIVVVEISLQLHRSIDKVQEETVKQSGLQLVVEGVVKVGGRRVGELSGEGEEDEATKKIQGVGEEVVPMELGHVDQAGGLVVEKVRQGLYCIVLISAFFM